MTLLTILRKITVEPILFFYMMVIFLESNVLQELISVKSCIDVIKPVNISDCSNTSLSKLNDTIKEEKASWVGYNSAVLFVFTFISSFYAASWSDKIGRKFTMLIPPLGTLLAALINFILSMHMNTSIAYIFISTSISGVTFGTLGIIAATFGFISDISDESSRTKRLVILEAMIYIGGTAGIYAGGELVKYGNLDSTINGFSLSFSFEMFVAVLIVLYIVFVIPSQSSDSFVPSEISCRNLFKLDHVKDSVRAVFRFRDAGKRKIVLLLLLSLFFIYFGLVVQLTLAYYYVEDNLEWSFTKYSHFNAIQFGVQGVTLLIGMPVFFHWLKIPDHIIALLGIVSKLGVYVTFGLSNSDVLVYSCIAWCMFAEFPVPAIRSILSKIVDMDEKGRIFAFTTMMQNFCFLIGSYTLTTIYNSMKQFPGLCFEIVAFLQACAFVIIIYLYLTRGEIVTTYEIMENEDGSYEESCKYEENRGSIN